MFSYRVTGYNTPKTEKNAYFGPSKSTVSEGTQNLIRKRKNKLVRVVELECLPIL